VRKDEVRASKPRVLYEPKPGMPLYADPALYQPIAKETKGRRLVDRLVVPKRSGKAWPVRAGQVCRVVLIEGPQVADLNLWNLHNPRERFWSGRTKQLHSAHLTVFDRFWSTLPYLRPLATITNETIQYGIDADGAGCHDILGTRCDPYVHKLLNNEEFNLCCHSNLTRAVIPYNLNEFDIHDNMNMFQVTGITHEGRYFAKPCPGQTGDFFEFFAEIDLLCAISACPHGDLSVPVWGASGSGAEIPCRPLGIEVYDVPEDLLRSWRSPQPVDYKGQHGLSYPERSASGA